MVYSFRKQGLGSAIMNTKISEKELIHLLDSGFKPSIIAFEFDLPEEYVLNLKQKNQASDIDNTIVLMQGKIEYMSSIPSDQRRAPAVELLQSLSKLSTASLSLEQIETIYSIISSDILRHVKCHSESDIPYRIHSAQRKWARKLADAITTQMEQTQNLEELQSLNSKLTLKITQFDPVSCGSVKYKLQNKISRLQQQSNRLKQLVSSEIISIAKSIGQDSFDSNTANETILEEAKKYLSNNTQSRFSLTTEQISRQILIKLRSLLTDQAEDFPITNPDKAIQDLCALNGISNEDAIKCVVRNFCGRTDFDGAKQLLGKYNSKYKGTPFMNDLSREVTICELTSFTKKYLSFATSPEEKQAFLAHLEKELKARGIKKTAIILEKDSNGARTVTLDNLYKEHNKTR